MFDIDEFLAEDLDFSEVSTRIVCESGTWKASEVIGNIRSERDVVRQEGPKGRARMVQAPSMQVAWSIFTFINVLHRRTSVNVDTRKISSRGPIRVSEMFRCNDTSAHWISLVELGFR